MKKHVKGISLIALIITIVIIVIIAGITIPKGLQRNELAKIAKHNQNISTIQEEIESYYNYKAAQLPVTDLTPYPVPSGTTLETEIIKNGEQFDRFYVVDLIELGKISGSNESTSANDIYIVSETRHNVYFIKGTTVKGVNYHGMISKNDVKLAQITGGITPTTTATPAPEATVTPTSAPTPLPNGAWDGEVNSPKLATGMTAVKWDGSEWIVANTSNLNNDWYDYKNTGGTANKWANARLADGSLLVWIPRYTYQITSGEHTSTAGNINIRFSNGTTDDTSGGYRIHPAFYWGGWNIPRSAAMTKQAGGTELTGIWVTKFEPSNDGTNKIRYIDNVASWTGMSIGTKFTKSREIQTINSATYGISTDTNLIDTHMLKNSEWGAIVYLSKYALGATSVAVNSNSSFITANGNIVTNKSQSTTGTAYGIYDMSGCAREYVAAYLNNSHANLTLNGNSLINANAKYKDVFPVPLVSEQQINNYNLINMAYGHAIWETSSSGVAGYYAWFSNYTNYIELSAPFLYRGGGNEPGAGIFFFHFDEGVGTLSSWRTSIVVP